MDITLRTIVIVFDRFNKEHLKYDSLRSLIPGETPELLDLPTPLAPVVFEYKRAGLTISIIDNKLQIQTSAPENAKATKEFTDIAGHILASLPDQQSIIAFGFNFNYTLRSVSKKVDEIVNLPTCLPTDSQFTFIPETYIKFTFDKKGIKHYLNLQDSGNDILVYVNVHHETRLQIDELRNQLSGHYNDACENSQQLIREVIST